jgi:hypothetical protein
MASEGARKAPVGHTLIAGALSWLCVASCPVGSCARFGLRNDATRASAIGAFDKFHVAYHGTKVSSLLGE